MQRKNKKAFTLVELIIVIAMVAIVGLAVISMMVPASNVFTHISNQAQAKMKASQVMQTIVPQVRYGTDMHILSANSNQIGSQAYSGYRYIYTNGDGKVYLWDAQKSGAADFFGGSSFYNNFKVALNFTVPSGASKTVQITVTVTLPNGSSSVLTTAVQNFNTEAISGSGTVIYYKWQTAPPLSS